jgi:protein-tyrosine phosphatase
LTDTVKYYNPELWTSCKYKKMNISGGGAVPSESYMRSFFELVDTEIENSQRSSPASDMKRFIGIHCTHGINRTGYLIVRLLLERCKSLDVKEAIRTFEESRAPHKIDKK